VRLAVGALELGGATAIETVRSATAGELEARLIPADGAVLSLAERFFSAPADRLLAAWEA
jgi:hypothetical protein